MPISPRERYAGVPNLQAVVRKKDPFEQTIPLTGFANIEEPERAGGWGLEETEWQKKTKRGRSQDRKRVAAGQDYEVRYEAKKTGKSKADVKRAIKRAGPSRKKVDKALRK